MSSDEAVKIIVACDTGPLISAFQCGRVDLLKRYFNALYLAPAQVVEIQQHGAAEELGTLIREEFVKLAAPVTAKESERAMHLAWRIAAHPASGESDYHGHLPEAELMVIAGRPELACVRILLDERAARIVATEEGLDVIGFPGVVGRAGLDGLLTKAEIRQVLGLCQRQGTHYSHQLIEHVAEMYGR